MDGPPTRHGANQACLSFGLVGDSEQGLEVGGLRFLVDDGGVRL